MDNNTEVGQKIEYIDIDYYTQQINLIIRQCCLQMGNDKPDTNVTNGFLRVAYNNLFKPDTGGGCNVMLNPENVSALIEIYNLIVETWNILPSVYAFERLTGLKIDKAAQYVTEARESIGNMRKAYIQNRLNNTPIGVLTLANNDIDTGLLYTRQNIVAHEAVKKTLSFDDLKRIAQNIEPPQDMVSRGDNPE